MVVESGLQNETEIWGIRKLTMGKIKSTNKLLKYGSSEINFYYKYKTGYRLIILVFFFFLL